MVKIKLEQIKASVEKKGKIGRLIWSHDDREYKTFTDKEIDGFVHNDPILKPKEENVYRPSGIGNAQSVNAFVNYVLVEEEKGAKVIKKDSAMLCLNYGDTADDIKAMILQDYFLKKLGVPSPRQGNVLSHDELAARMAGAAKIIKAGAKSADKSLTN